MNNENHESVLTEEKIKEVLKIIKRLEKRNEKLIHEINLRRKQLELICTHFETKVVNKYFEGSYYDKAEYVKEVICTICDKVLKSTSTEGGYG